MILDRRLLAQSRFSRGLITLAVLLGWVGGIFTILQAGALSRVVTGAFLEGQNLAALTPWLVVLLVVFIVRSLLQWGGEVAAGQSSIRIRLSLRRMLLEHILALGPAYTKSEQTGAQAAAALQGVDALDAYFSQYLPQVALSALVPLSVIAISFPIDWLSGLIFFLTAPLIPVFMVLIGQASATLARRQFTALSRMSAFLLDTIQGLTTLKLLNQSAAQAEHIALVSDQYRQKTMSVLRVAFLSALVLEMVGTLSTAIIAVQIGLRLLNGGLPFEQAFFILILAPEFYLPLRLLGQRFHAAETGRAAAQRIFEVLAIPLAVEGSHELPSFESGVKVVFDRVGFQYPDRSEATLEEVTFTIQPNRVTTLVGLSGAGKTTIAQLLLGFLKPETGVIRINEVNLVSLPVNAWRSHVAWLPQHPHIFHGTIGFNLRLGHPQATLEEMLIAAKKASLEQFLETLPDRFETVVGDGGLALSGGQMQRVALARAFLANPRLLIVDEPTAWLDPQLEKDLTASLTELSRERTVLTIAHRLETVLQADWVLVLEAGRVVEQGAPDDLASRNGPFAQLLSAGGELP